MKPILYIRADGRGALTITVLAIVMVAGIFAGAIATGTSLAAAFFFASLVVMVVAEARQRLEQFGSIEDARRELDRMEREGRR